MGEFTIRGGEDTVAPNYWQRASSFSMEHDVLGNYKSDATGVILQTHREAVNTG